MNATRTRTFLPFLRDLRWWRVSRKAQVIFAVAAAVILGLRAQWYLVHRVDLWTGLIFWAFASTVFLYGLWQARGVLVDGGMSEAAVDQPGETVISRRLEIALFAAVLGVGIFFRLYRLGDIPPGLNHDAAFHGLYAIRIDRGIRYAPVVACCGQVAHETTLAYFIAGFQHVVGYTALAIELAAALIGILTLVAFYLLMRRMFEPRVALVATFLLGVSGWHLTFSRVGWHTILVPLFEALTFYFLLGAIESRRIRDFLLAGFVLGLSLYTYDAAHSIPFSVGAFVAYLLVRNRSLIRTHLRGFAVYGVAAAGALAPLAWWAYHNWDQYTGRSRSLWIGNRIQEAGSWQPFWHNIGDTLLIFNFRAHGDDFFVRQPLLDIPISVFFVLGLGYSLTRLRRPEHVLLLTMLVFSLGNGFLSVPNGNRAMGAVLPVAAYAGLFLAVAWRWLQRAFPTRLVPYWGLGLVVVMAIAANGTFQDYLGPHHRTQWGFYPEATRVGRYVKTIADDYDVHLLAGNWPRNTVTYLSYGGNGDPFQCRYTYTSNADELLASADTDGCPAGKSRPPSPDRGTAYVIEAVPEYSDAFAYLRSSYPTASEDQIYYGKIVIANVLLVPASASAKVTPSGPGQSTQPGPTAVPPGAAERDAERRRELGLLFAELLKYRAEHGSYPTTDNNLQTACAYEEIDVLCQFKTELDPGTFLDPLGDPHDDGYWYASDGNSFVLYGILEKAPEAQESCKGPGELAHKKNLYCIQGG